MAVLEHPHDSGCASWILIVVISWSTNLWPRGQVDTKLWCQSACPKEAWIALEKHRHRGNLGGDVEQNEREKTESNGAMLIHKSSYITTRPYLTGKMFWYSDLQDLVVLQMKTFWKYFGFCKISKKWEFPTRSSWEHIPFAVMTAQLLKFSKFSSELIECNKEHILACWL